MRNYNPITQLQPITSLNGLDVLPIVDVTDLTQSPSGSTKKVTMTQLQDFIENANPWITVTSGPVTLVPEQGYIIDGTVLILLSLPLTANVGDEYFIQGLSTNLFQIDQNTGQQIIFGNTQTSVGSAGHLVSTNRGDVINLICVQQDLLFKVSNVIGNPIIL